MPGRGWFDFGSEVPCSARLRVGTSLSGWPGRIPARPHRMSTSPSHLASPCLVMASSGEPFFCGCRYSY